MLKRIKIFLWRIFYPARYDAYVIARYNKQRFVQEIIAGYYAELRGNDFVKPIDALYKIIGVDTKSD